MPSSVWILNLVVLAAVLEADLGRRKIARRRLARPVIILGIVMVIYVRGIGTGGDALLFEALLAGAGVALGVAAGAIFRIFRGADGSAYSQAGVAYAARWVAVWLFTHRISGEPLTAGLIFMAAGMLLARTAMLYLRASRVPIASAREDFPQRLAA
jgi:hypothetical protein